MFVYTVTFIRHGSDKVETVDFICPDFETAYGLTDDSYAETVSIVRGASFSSDKFTP